MGDRRENNDFAEKNSETSGKHSVLTLNPTMSGEHAKILHDIRERLGVPTYPEAIRKTLEEFEGNFFVILTENRKRQLQNMLQFSHLKYEIGSLNVESLVNWILLKGISLIKKKIGTIYDPSIRARMTVIELKVVDALMKTAYDPEWALGMTIKDLTRATGLLEHQVRSIVDTLVKQGLIAEHPELKGHFFVLT